MKGGRKPYFTIEQWEKNPVQHVFDVVEYHFYNNAPRVVGITRGATTRNNEVYLEYSIDEVRSGAVKFLRDGFYKRFISESYKMQNVLYSAIFFDEIPSEPRAFIDMLYRYYAPQQFLRVFIAETAVSILSNYGIDIHMIGFDEPPAFDSNIPRHIGLVAMGYTRALGNSNRKQLKDNTELFNELGRRGVDFASIILPYIQSIVWAQYFAQTEDAYVFALIKRYLETYDDEPSRLHIKPKYMYREGDKLVFR